MPTIFRVLACDGAFGTSTQRGKDRRLEGGPACWRFRPSCARSSVTIPHPSRRPSNARGGRRREVQVRRAHGGPRLSRPEGMHRPSLPPQCAMPAFRARPGQARVRPGEPSDAHTRRRGNTVRDLGLHLLGAVSRSCGACGFGRCAWNARRPPMIEDDEPLAPHTRPKLTISPSHPLRKRQHRVTGHDHIPQTRRRSPPRHSARARCAVGGGWGRRCARLSPCRDGAAVVRRDRRRCLAPPGRYRLARPGAHGRCLRLYQGHRGRRFRDRLSGELGGAGIELPRGAYHFFRNAARRRGGTSGRRARAARCAAAA